MSNNKTNIKHQYHNMSDSHRHCAMSKMSSTTDTAAVTASSSSTACRCLSHTMAAISSAGPEHTCELQEQQLDTEHNQSLTQSKPQIYKENMTFDNGDTVKINNQLNNIFERRLTDIDHKACGNVNLKLITYQDWVNMLLHSNKVLIDNLEGLEKEVAERMELLTQKSDSPCRSSQNTELQKCRKDICTLLRVVQNGYHHDNWSIEGMEFETLTPSQVFGNDVNDHQNDDNITVASNEEQFSREKTSTPAQHNNMVMSMMALANEIAEKHDEIRDLKRQICCMEDEIQKAQQKIQLKDDVIRELRNDRKKDQMNPINLEFPILSTQGVKTQVSSRFTPISYIDDRCRSNQQQQLERVELPTLDEEIKELFEGTKHWETQNIEIHRKRLANFFYTSEMDKMHAYHKLEYLRQQLIELDRSTTDGLLINTTSTGSTSITCDSAICKNDNDHNDDKRIMDSLRQHFCNLRETVIKLTKYVQKLEIEKNELRSNLETEIKLSQSDSVTLK